MSDLETFRSQIDLLDVAEQLTEVRRTGGGHGIIRCPEHSPDLNPSCHLYPDHYYCFTCKAHGDVIRLAMLLRDLGFGEALDWLAEATGVERPQRSPEAEATAAAMKALRAALNEGLEGCDPEELPAGLTIETARRLGLGRARELASLVAELPRPLLGADEVIAWEGAWTIELHGKSGPLGFGAFLAPSPPGPGEPFDDEVFGDDSFDEAGPPEGEYAQIDGEYIGSPESPASPNMLAAEVPSAEEPGLASSAPEHWPFVRARALRVPAFGGYGVARETVARQHTVIVTPDMGELLTLQAAGLAGVISAGVPLDEPTIVSLAELARRIVLVATPERRAAPDFAATLLRLAATGRRIEVVALARLLAAAAGESSDAGRVPLFAYFLAAATRLADGGRRADAERLLSRYLAAVPSPSSRALYAAELTRAGFVPAVL